MNEFSDRPDHQSPTPPAAGPVGPSGPADREVYNIVTDTLAGPNVRWRDNLLQAAITIGGLLAGVPGGWLYAKLNSWDENDQMGCAIVGAFVGLVVGLFGSGIFLMVYRGMRHIRGKHD